MQGASDAGLIPMFLPDYQSVTDDGVRSAFHEIWNSEGIASEKGLTVTEIMDAIHDDKISSMYSLGENPAMSDPDADRSRRVKTDRGCTGYFLAAADYADVVCLSRLKNWNRNQHKPPSSDG